MREQFKLFQQNQHKTVKIDYTVEELDCMDFGNRVVIKDDELGA
jgi:hypothetical protein